jgi:hypothetical protein
MAWAQTQASHGSGRTAGRGASPAGSVQRDVASHSSAGGGDTVGAEGPTKVRPPDSLAPGAKRLPVKSKRPHRTHRPRRWATVGHAGTPSP